MSDELHPTLSHGEALLRINELIKERDLAREMLVGDQTHVSCGIYERNLQKKYDRLKEENIELRKGIKKALDHWGNVYGKGGSLAFDLSGLTRILKEALKEGEV